MMAFATRDDGSAQDASSTLAERLPAMCGSDTFTTVVSSTSIKVANMTATATIHGLTCGCSCGDGISRFDGNVLFSRIDGRLRQRWCGSHTHPVDAFANAVGTAGLFGRIAGFCGRCPETEWSLPGFVRFS